MPYRNPAPRLQRTVEFSDDEIIFLRSLEPWSRQHWSKAFGTPEQNNSRDNIKDKIKSELENIQDNYCAFCGLNLKYAYRVEREHIAPQYKHPHYIFEPENLVLACNFCNQHKMKKKTVIEDTQNYTTTSFSILHPHRDNFCDYLENDIENFDLVFSIVGPEPIKTQKTIDCVGLNAPHLITQRGAIILKAVAISSPRADRLVKQIVERNRRHR